MRSIRLGRPKAKLSPRAIRRLRRELAGLTLRRHSLWNRFALPRKIEDQLASMRSRAALAKRKPDLDLHDKLKAKIERIERRRPSIPQATVGREVSQIDRRSSEIASVLEARS